jgi:hypothetical protein
MERIRLVDAEIAADVSKLVRRLGRVMPEDQYVDLYLNLLIGESHAHYWHVDSGVSLRVLRTYVGPGECYHYYSFHIITAFCDYRTDYL